MSNDPSHPPHGALPALQARLYALEDEAAAALPPDFTARVLLQLPQQVPATTRAPRAGRWLQAAALAVGGALGLLQLLAYVLGLWLVGAAG
jgi:hypothetical protein